MIQLTYTTYLMHALSPVNRVLYLYSASKTKPSFLFVLFFYKSIFSSNILGKGAPFFDGSLCDWIWFLVFFSNWLFGGV